MSGLIKKPVTDKNGNLTHRWVKPESASAGLPRPQRSPKPPSSTLSSSMKERPIQLPSGKGAYSEKWRIEQTENLNDEEYKDGYNYDRLTFSGNKFSAGYSEGGLIYWDNPENNEQVLTAMPHDYAIGGASSDPVVEKTDGGYTVYLVGNGFDPDKYVDYEEYYAATNDEDLDNTVISFEVDQVGYWTGTGTYREFDNGEQAEEFMSELRK